MKNIWVAIKNNKPSFPLVMLFLFSVTVFVIGIALINEANDIRLKSNQIFGGSTSFRYDGEVFIKVDGNNLVIEFPDLDK